MIFSRSGLSLELSFWAAGGILTSGWSLSPARLLLPTEGLGIGVVMANVGCYV